MCILRSVWGNEQRKMIIIVLKISKEIDLEWQKKKKKSQSAMSDNRKIYIRYFSGEKNRKKRKSQRLLQLEFGDQFHASELGWLLWGSHL